MSRIISNTFNAGNSLVNGDNPVSITATGRITDNTYGYTIYGPGGVSKSWTVTNAGTLIEQLSTGNAVLFGDQGTPVSNGVFLNQSGGLITSTHNGVVISGPGTITNMAGATILSSDAGIADAVYIGAFGTVINGGLIQAANVAVYDPASAQVTNMATGTITGAGGVYLMGPSTVTNAGTITGTKASYGAVFFGSLGGSSRLIANPGAVFNGKLISLTNSTNVIELTSAAGAGTLSGFDGTVITNFATLQFDSGATWTVNGSGNTAGLGAILINGFATGDTLAMPGTISVTQSSFSSGVTKATLSSGGTLKFTGSISAFSTLTSGGVTKLTLGAPPVPVIVSGGTASFAGGGSSSVLDSTLTLSDAGAANLIGAIIVINSGFILGDTLNFTNQNGITGSFNSATGTLTLSGTASVADYQTALESIGYSFSPANGDPTSAGNDPNRGITWRAIDSSGTGTATASTLHTSLPLPLVYGQTIVETGIVAATETVTVGSMTLKNGGGTTVGTIAVGVSLGTGDFLLNPDGPGTDVIVSSVFGTYASGVTLLTNPTTITSTGRVNNAANSDAAVRGPTGTAWTVTNLGSVSESGATGGTGIAFAAAGTIVNAGAVGADVSQDSSTGISLAAGGVVTNQASGTVQGYVGIRATGGTATIVNGGGIAGNLADPSGTGVALLAGGSVTNQASGTISGNRGFVANGGAASVVNSGHIIGGTVGFDGYGLLVQGGGTVTNLVGGTISGYLGIGARNAQAVISNAGYIGGAPVASGGIGIDLHAGGSVTNLAGGTVSASGFGIEIDNASGTVINDGGVTAVLASAGSDGVLLSDGGEVTNQVSGVIQGYVAVRVSTAAGTVVNQGQIIGGELAANGYGVSLGAGGSVTNQSGGTIAGYNGILIAGGAGTVRNLGSIGADYSSYGNNGIYLRDGGEVINGAASSTVSTANISAYRSAVKFGSATAGTLMNYGAVLYGQSAPAVVMNNGVVINGPGGLTGALIKSGAADVIDIGGDGTVVNYGTIENVNVSGLHYGVSLTGTGVISNRGAASLILASDGVYANGNATIVNAGTISDDNSSDVSNLIAVRFGTGTNRLIVDPGAVFIGGLNGRGTAAQTGTTTLELATGSSAGVLSGFGTTITNFATLQFDSGTNWTVVGNASASGLGTLAIDGFTFGDTIDLTGFVATGKTFTTGSLVLSNGGGSRTLAVNGSLTTANFVIAPDNTDGTEITLQEVLSYGQTIVETGIVAASETVSAGTMTLFNSGTTAVGTLAVGASLSTGDFTLKTAGSDTDVIVSSIFGTYTGGVTLLTNPTRVDASASVANTNVNGYGIYGPGGGGKSWTIDNFGIVTGTKKSGVQFGSYGNTSAVTAGVITNESGGLISGANGVYVFGTGSVTNLVGGGITGQAVALQVSGGLGTVVNAGAISSQNKGVYLQVGGSVTNLAGGTIDGGSGFGVQVLGGGTIRNAGTIKGGFYAIFMPEGGYVTNAATGVVQGNVYMLSGPSTLVNAGTLTGNLTFNGTGNLLVADPGAVFNGILSGGGGTIELASAVSAGTLAGFNGVNITNFSSIQFDPGSQWTISGSGSPVGLGAGTIGGFTYGDTIDVSGFVATSRTFTPGQLVLGNAGGSETLAITGTFATENVAITPDTNGGTDITLQPLLNYGQTVVETGILATTETVSAGVMTLKNGGGTVVGTVVVGTSLSTGDFTLRPNGGDTDVIVTTVFGTYTNGVTLTDTTLNPVSVRGNVRNVGGSALYATGGSSNAWTIANRGTIANADLGIQLGTNGLGGGHVSAAAVTNLTGGLISGESTAIHLYSDGSGYVLNQAGATISNTGTGSESVVDFFNQGSVFNAGLISGGTASYGIALEGGGSVTNSATGTIEAGNGGVVAYSGGAVDNAGKILGNGRGGVDLYGGTSVINRSGGTISGTQGVNVKYGDATVVNYGALIGIGDSGVYEGGGGAITNQSSGTISGYDGVKGAGATVTVVNSGIIAGNYTVGTAVGVNLSAGGSVTNLSSGTISGHADGVMISGGSGTVHNLGRIQSYDNSSNTINGGQYGVRLADGGLVVNGTSGGTVDAAYISGYGAGIGGPGADVTVVNYGSVVGTPRNLAVILNTGTLINGPSGATSALIQGKSGSAVLILGSGSVSNAGTIIGGANASASSAYYGIRLGGAGAIGNLGPTSLIQDYVGIYALLNDTVTNAGTIASNAGTDGNALIFGAGNNRLIVDPGARFIGKVSGGGTATVTLNSTPTIIGTANTIGGTVLELAVGASPGTLGALGSSITNFTSLVFDLGAQWTVTGDDSPGGFGTHGIGGFTFGDTIDLTGFLAVSRTFTPGALVLTNLGGAHETLAVAGSFHTANFVITPDSSGGTDITLQPALFYADTVVETGIIATTETVTAGVMTLRDGGGTFVGTIAVGTSLSTGDFRLVSSGADTKVVVHTATGTYTSGLTLLVNPTTIGSLATIDGTLASGVGVNGPTGTNWTVTNQGTISEAGAGGIGVRLASPGTVSEAGGGTIHAAGVGVSLAGGGVVSAQSGGSITGLQGVAASADATVTNAGYIGGNTTAGLGFAVNLAGGGAVTNLTGGTISGYDGITAGGAAATINNAGRIAGNATLSDSFGVLFNAGGTITNQATGVVSGLDAIVGRTSAIGVVNFGLISGNTTNSTAVGVYLTAGGSVTNATSASVTGYEGVLSLGVATVVNAGGIGGSTINTIGVGVDLVAAGSVTNQAGGVIGGFDGVVSRGTVTVVNAGTIHGVTNNTTAAGLDLLAAASVTNQAGGVIQGFGAVYGKVSATTVVNAGSIGGNAAAGAGIALVAGGVVTNQATAIVSGNWGIYAVGPTRVVNSGIIGGNTSSGVGANLVGGGALTNLSGGTITGKNAVVLAGGTVTNAGGITGNATGGIGIALLAAATVTNQAGGTISGGTDAVRFAAGQTNLLVVQPGAVFIGAVDGGNPLGGTSISTLELTAGTGTLSGLGTKYINFAQTTIDAGATWNFSGVNTVANGMALTIAGTLIVSGTVVNYGFVTGYPFELRNGTLLNHIGGELTSSSIYGVIAGGADYVVNQGQIIQGKGSAIYLKSGGTVSNAATGLISGYGEAVKIRGTGAVVTNLGSITDTAIFDSYGVYLRDGGLITNGQAGVGTDTASIQGYYGLTTKAVETPTAQGTLVNYGTVLGTGTAATAVRLSNGGMVLNGQSGATGALIQSGRMGVYGQQAVVVNAAIIRATGTTDGDYGVFINTTGQVSNLGTGALIEGYGGVFIDVDGTVTNSGTIQSNQGTAGVAVHFTGGNAKLIDDPGAVFIGSVFGGTGGTAVLELASGGTGTVAGLGTSVTNFTSLVFDPSAAWTVIGNDSTTGLGTLAITGFAAGDTIDLTGFAATSRVFSDGTLTLSNGGTQQTLRFTDNFVTDNFLIEPDKSTGTDIIFQTPPSVTAGGTVAFTGGGSPVTLDGSLTVTDPTSATLNGATISIGTGFVAGDKLNFTNQNGITGSFVPGTGVLTLTGVVSVANYQAALDSITYSFTPANGDPTGGGGHTSRTIDWVVNDSTAAGATGVSTLSVIHVPPTLTAGGTVTFHGGDAPLALDTALTLSDPDSLAMLNSGTVIILGSFAGDTLTANTSGMSITASLNAGTLTLSGTDTVADYQAVLRSVKYSFNPADGDPTIGGADTSRAITWTVNDGAAVSNTGGSALTLAHIAPTVTAGGTVTFTGGGTAVALDTSIVLADPDSFGDLTGATITIATGQASTDRLNFTNQNGIIGNFNGTTGVLTLSGTATIANYESALASITYDVNPAGTDPTGGGGDTSRTIDWVVSDGSSSNGASNIGTSTLSLAHVAPTIAAVGTVSFSGGGNPVALDSSATVTAPDSSGELSGATISIASGFLTGDTLNFINQNKISGSYDSSTHTLTLTGLRPVSVYQTALDSITYGFSPPGGDPTGGGGDTSRTIDWVVNDGVANSGIATSTINVAHVAPTIAAGATASFTGGGNPVVLDGSIVVTAPDSGGQISGATISIASGFVFGDTLTFSGQNGISGTYSAITHALTLTGATSAANYQTALDSITYGFNPANGDPTNGGGDTSRTIDWRINDGVSNSGVVTSTVSVAHVAPTITAGATASFTGGGKAVVLDGGVIVVDPDSGGVLTGATISIASGFLSGDSLGFSSQNGITGVYDAKTHVLTLAGTASIANYEAALDSIVYGFTPGNGDPTGGVADISRTINWVVNDGAAASDTGVSTLNVIHAAPTVTVPGTPTFVIGGGAVALGANATVTDPDSGGNLSGATIAIGNGLLAGDTLTFVNQNGISGTYDSKAGVLTLKGGATIANYQAALDSITYSSSAGDPTDGGKDPTRTISWSAGDAVATGESVTSSLAVSFAQPVIAGALGAQTTTDSTAIAPFKEVSISDALIGQTETVTVTLSDPVNGALSVLGGGVYDKSTGVFSITGLDATVSSAVEGLLFTPTVHQTVPGASVTTTFTIKVTDSAGSISDSTTKVGATAVHDAPVIGGAIAGQTTTDAGAISLFTGVSIGDVDFGQTETVTITLSNHLNGALSNLGGGGYDSSTGVYLVTGSDAAVSKAVAGLVFTPTAHQVAPGASVTTTFSIKATDTAGDSSGNATTTVGATAVKDAPLIAGAKSGQTTTDASTLAPLAGVSISDVDFGQTETVTVTLSDPTNGSLSNLGGGGYDAVTGVYTVTGTDAAVSTAVDGLVFTPTAHQVPPGGQVITTFTIAATDTAGATSSDNKSTVSVTAVNNQPVVSGAVAARPVADNATIAPFAGVTITDADAGATTSVTITLTRGGVASDANGILSGAGLSKSTTGVYTLAAGTPGAISVELDGLVFTPTVHEVAPGATIATGMTLAVSDGIGGPTTDPTTSVVATAVGTPPAIVGALANQGVPDQTPSNPFAAVTLVDPDFGATETATVTLSAPGNGTLSNLSGGTYDASTGVYQVTGTPGADTAALRALVFTPILQPNVNVTTTRFAISPGAGGITDTTTSVTSVRQILSLAAVPANKIAISVSPDGTGFATAQNGMTNEAVVIDPVENDSFTVPAGYQALFAGGTADVTLTDAAVGNALLVANLGNDNLIANAINDVLVAGTGRTSLVGGAFASTVVGGSGPATVFAAAGAMQVISGSGPISFSGKSNAGSSVIGGSGPDASPVQASLTGQNQTASLGASAATITAAGSGNNVIGGTAPLSATLSGSANTVQAGAGSSTVASSGSGNLVVGGSVSGAGPLIVNETGSNDTIVGGANPTTVAASTATQVIGGSGGLNFVGGTGTSTVFGGTGATSLTAGVGGVQFVVGASNSATVNSGSGSVSIFGAPGASVNVVGGSASHNFVVAGAGNETLNAAGSSSNNWLSINTTVSSAAAATAASPVALVGGSGNDTLISGSAPGSAIMTGGGGNDAFVFFKQVTGNWTDIVTDFTANDQVFIEGYGTGSAASLQSAARVSTAGVTLTLNDGTTVTFSNLTDAGALNGKIQYRMSPVSRHGMRVVDRGGRSSDLRCGAMQTSLNTQCPSANNHVESGTVQPTGRIGVHPR